MSNELFNAHIAMGSPCGDDADMDQIANWAGLVILGDMTEFNEMKARAEKAEAILAWLKEQADAIIPGCEELDAAQTVFGTMAALKAMAEQAEAELAKREKALEEACKAADIDIYNGELRVAGHKAEGQELAEWLKNRK